MCLEKYRKLNSILKRKWTSAFQKLWKRDAPYFKALVVVIVIYALIYVQIVRLGYLSYANGGAS